MASKVGNESTQASIWLVTAVTGSRIPSASVSSKAAPNDRKERVYGTPSIALEPKALLVEESLEWSGEVGEADWVGWQGATPQGKGRSAPGPEMG